MEAVRQVDSVTNTRDRSLQNRSQSKEKSSYQVIQQDTADLTPSAIALSREGMDIKRSTVVEQEKNIQYDLHFKDVMAKKLQAKGEVDKNTEEASAQIEFEVKKDQTVKNIPRNKSLRFFLSFKFTEFQHTAARPEKNKNMSMYVRELVGDIENILGKKMENKGDNINQEDLKRIHSSEKKKISSKLIQLIKISMSMANMRKSLEENEPEKIENPKNQQKVANVKSAKLQELNLEVTEERNKTLNES